MPAGTYTVEAWHEKLGTQTQSVTLGEKESKEMSFTFKAASGALSVPCRPAGSTATPSSSPPRTVLLIAAGGMVTSTGSGLSVPDWPNTYGWFMFSFPHEKWVGGIFYEHGHRLIASTVGFLTIILAVWTWRVEPRRWVRWLAFGALGAVILQGLLGGLTVLFLLPAAGLDRARGAGAALLLPDAEPGAVHVAAAGGAAANRCRRSDAARGCGRRRRALDLRADSARRDDAATGAGLAIPDFRWRSAT